MNYSDTSFQWRASIYSTLCPAVLYSNFKIYVLKQPYILGCYFNHLDEGLKLFCAPTPSRPPVSCFEFLYQEFLSQFPGRIAHRGRAERIGGVYKNPTSLKAGYLACWKKNGSRKTEDFSWNRKQISEVAPELGCLIVRIPFASVFR